jgi:predicted deacylase
MDIELVNLDSDTPGQNFSLRIVRFRGSGDGPSVYIQAALHAHELPGVVALDRLIPLLEKANRERRLASDVTLVPHANPIGLSQALVGETLGRFDFNSRLNFNRSFPSGPPESLVGRAADDQLKALLVSLAVQAEIVLDLHCDDEGPIYLYVAERQLEEGRRLAQAISADFILYTPDDDAVVLPEEVASRWKSQNRPNDRRFAATLEYRGMIDVTHEMADRDAAGLYRYLVAVGAVRDTLSPSPAIKPIVGHINDAELIPTPVPGAVLYDVEVGDQVVSGQRLAAILPHPGADPHEVCAPYDGIAMTRRNFRFVRRGDHVIKVLRLPGRHPERNT